MTKTEIGLIAFEIFGEIGEKIRTSAIDNILPTLDEIVFLSPKSLGYNTSGILIGKMEDFADIILKIANISIFIMLLWFAFRSIFAHFFDLKIENPLKGIMRMIIVAIFINSAYFITFSGIYFSSGFTDMIREKIGTNIVSFEYLNDFIDDNVEEITDEEDVDILEKDNSLNIIIYFLIISFSILCGMRYVLLHILVLLAPIFFSFLLTKDTTKIFISWLKAFGYSLSIQVVATLLVSMSYITKVDGEVITKIIICGILITLDAVMMGMVKIIK